MRAVVADDSKAMRLFLGRILKEFGFDEVIEAANGQEALQRLTTESIVPDVALVDWNMPEMNGYDFVCAVRADRSFDEMRLMMVTTETEMEQVAKALEAGVDEYVMKPFTKEVIMAKLAYLGLFGR
jgi:two-component system, chemotaxis family, chemotaxis protein CheY